MQRFLVIIGALVFFIGLLWPWVSRLPFGSLPGDIRIERPGFTFYFPLGTCVVLSILLSLVLAAINWFMRR